MRKNINKNIDSTIFEYSIHLKKVRAICNNIYIINTSEDAFKLASQFYDYDDREKLYIIMMDSRKKVIGINLVSIGIVDKVMMHPREIFKPSILLGASSFIMVHNHPSGDVTPSKEDMRLTDRIIECGNMLDIPLMDHIIFSEKNYFSIYNEMD